MKSINRFTVCGHIGAITPFDDAVKINVATSRQWRDDAGERKEATDWVTLTVLDKAQAAYLKESAKVGDSVFAEARVTNGSYKRDGQTVYTTDIITSTLNHFPKN